MDLEELIPNYRNPVRKSKWISGKDLIARWGIMAFELFDYMKIGLQAYTQHGNKIVDSDPLDKAPRHTLEFFIISIKRREIAGRVGGGKMRQPRSEWEINKEAKSLFEAPSNLQIVNPPPNCELMSFTIPENEKKVEEMFAQAKAFLFKVEDVLNFEGDHGIIPLGPQTHPDHPEVVPLQDEKENSADMTENAGLLSRGQVKGDNYFIREGKVWRIGFEGEKGSFPDFAYIRCLAFLLNKAGEFLSCVELAQLIKEETGNNEVMTKSRVMAEGLGPSTRTKQPDVILDGRAKKEFGEKLKSLEAEKDKLEVEAAQGIPGANLDLMETEQEIEYIKKELLKHKKFNTFEEPLAKNAQSNINKHLKTAYKTIEEANMKNLSEHLTKKIKPGGGYDYRYIDVDLHWDISW